jgi:hypothetical protein
MMRCFFGHDPAPSQVPSSPLEPQIRRCQRCDKEQHVYKMFRTRWHSPEYWEKLDSYDLRHR